MATYGYARVSSSDQSTDTQVQKLKAVGCQVVRTEKLSGKSREGRDQLATVLEFIGPGDVLVCVKLDRLGRATRDVLNLVTSSTRRARIAQKVPENESGMSGDNFSVFMWG
jgi:DNA invertase Pin-like site-specific DNA recombinase